MAIWLLITWNVGTGKEEVWKRVHGCWALFLKQIENDI